MLFGGALELACGCCTAITDIFISLGVALPYILASLPGMPWLPAVLQADVDKVLKPRLQFLLDLGLPQVNDSSAALT